MQGSRTGPGAAVILLDDRRVPWHVRGNLRQGEPIAYVRGHATDGDQHFEHDHLSQRIHQLALRGRECLEVAVPNFNGGWAFVVEWPDGEILAAVDRMRTVPLFFYHDRDNFAVAASGIELAHRFSRPMNTRAQLELLLFRYITGSETLYDGVHQLQSGEMAFYHPEQQRCSTSRYYRFYPTTIAIDSAELLSEALADTIQRMFERFRDAFRGKRVVVPLSGGLDSRLVAAMLKRVGFDDCVCFSYGDKSDEEVRISRQVAETLGYPWRFVPYSSEVWSRWNRSQTMREFVRYACKGTSSPHLQDFPAVMQLADEGFGGDDTVFFPGHSADMNAGSHIPTDYSDILSGRLSPTEHILRGHGRGNWDDPAPLLNAPAAVGLLEKIGAHSAAPPGAAFEDRVACCDMWNAEQRQAKYIINSVRTYEFVGSRWRTLWDYEFMDFFLRVPVDLRYGQRLYLDCLRNRIFVDKLAPLAMIPVAKHGPLSSLSTLRPPAAPSTVFSRWRDAVKRRVRLQLLRIGVARQHFSNVDSSQSIRTQLSGLEIPDKAVTFEEALNAVGALPWLDAEVRDALRPLFDYKLDSLRFLGVLATIALAEMTKDINTKTIPDSTI